MNIKSLMVWLLFFLVLFFLVVSGRTFLSGPTSPAQMRTVPLSLTERITLAVGKPSRTVEKPLAIDITPDKIKVLWALNSYGTSEDVRREALLIAIAVLRVVHEANPTYKTVNLTGTIPLVDRFGNVSEEIGFWLIISRDTVNRINWANKSFVGSGLHQQLPRLADRFGFHQAIRD